MLSSLSFSFSYQRQEKHLHNPINVLKNTESLIEIKSSLKGNRILLNWEKIFSESKTSESLIDLIQSFTPLSTSHS